jgi:hypothetical protein
MEATSPREGNLGELQQSRRLRAGVIRFGFSIVLAVVALKLEVPRLWMLALFVPFALGANGIYMGLYNT